MVKTAKFSLLFIISVLLSFHSIDPVKDWVNNDIEYLYNFYKERHANPEISLKEKETANSLANELESVGYKVERNFGGYGIVGILKNGKGPTVLYRTDMDALPMEEKTGLEYASQLRTTINGNDSGTMHSCGHDLHMTTLLGTARYMAQNKKEWKGTLMLIGQPAEEIGKGAKMMLDEGLYQKFGVPDYGVGLHSNPTLEAGSIGISDGYTMANAEFIDIEVFGSGAHGASPHMSIDPVVISSMIIMELQTIVSRNLKPIDDAVITVGAIQGGTVGNIIPDQVTLRLTVRTFKEDVRQMIHKRMREVCNGVAMAAGLPEDKWPELHIPEVFTPANYNDPVLTERIKASVGSILGEDKLLYAEPQLVGEDFSRYGNTDDDVPTVLFWLGTVSKEKIEKGNLPGLHSPFYYPEPQKSIETGVLAMTEVLKDLFNKK